MADICVIADVKAWLGIPSSNVADDSLLTRLISATSGDFLDAIDRHDFTPAAAFTENIEIDRRKLLPRYPGSVLAGTGNTGNLRVGLRHWPINSISYVTLDTTAVAIDTIGNSGAVRAANVVTIKTKTPHGAVVGSTVAVNGVSVGTDTFNGVFVAASVPSPTTLTYPQTGANETQGGGTAQLAIPASADGIADGWWFDASEDPEYRNTLRLINVTLSPSNLSTCVSVLTVVYNAGYATVPADVVQAAIEWVSYRYKSRQFIGQQSKHMSAGGESVTYQIVDMPPSVKTVITRYASRPPEL